MSRPTYEELIQVLSDAAEHEADLGNADKSDEIRRVIEIVREQKEAEDAD